MHTFLKDMSSMISNGLKCPCDVKLKLHLKIVYNKIFKNYLPRLATILDKYVFPTPTKIYNQLTMSISTSIVPRRMM